MPASRPTAAVAHIAAYYGYDVDDPAERIYALGVMNLGLAGDVGKLVAYRELNNSSSSSRAGKPGSS